MIALNIKCKILGMFEISHGTACHSFCEPREIFMKALLCGASNIILAHNHLSQVLILLKKIYLYITE